MNTEPTQTFADADLSKMMAAANKARSEELSKMFRNARAYLAGVFTSHGATAPQG